MPNFNYTDPDYLQNAIEALEMKVAALEIKVAAPSASLNKQSDAITLDEIDKMIRAKDQFFASATLLIDMLKMRS
jgi:hypothetical protein